VQKRTRSLPVAFGAVLAGYASAVVLAVDGNGEVGGAFVGGLTIYGWSHAALAITLLVAGLLLMVVRQHDAVVGLTAVAGLYAAQLAGTGLVGVRRWPLYWGCCAPPVSQQELVRNLPWAMALACAVTALISLAALARRFLRSRPDHATVALPVALAVVASVPVLAAGAASDVGDIVAWGLMYSLPFGIALAVSAFLPRGTALALIAAVASSAGMAALDGSFIVLVIPPADAMTVVIGAALVVALSRLVPVSLARSRWAAR
jgi:hypothetical protein